MRSRVGRRQREFSLSPFRFSLSAFFFSSFLSFFLFFFCFFFFTVHFSLFWSLSPPSWRLFTFHSFLVYIFTLKQTHLLHQHPLNSPHHHITSHHIATMSIPLSMSVLSSAAASAAASATAAAAAAAASATSTPTIKKEPEPAALEALQALTQLRSATHSSHSPHSSHTPPPPYWGTVLPPPSPSLSHLVEATLQLAHDDAAAAATSSASSTPMSTSASATTRLPASSPAPPTAKKPRKARKSKKSPTTTQPRKQSTPSAYATPADATPFACLHCPKRFSRKSNLDSHLITHSTSRPHLCSHCGKAFARLSDRTRHEGTTHKPTKTYQCRGKRTSAPYGEWGCGHFYSRADGLRKHFKSFAGRQCLWDFLQDRDGPSAATAHHHLLPPLAKDRKKGQSPTGEKDKEKDAQEAARVEAAIRNVREHCGW